MLKSSQHTTALHEHLCVMTICVKELRQGYLYTTCLSSGQGLVYGVRMRPHPGNACLSIVDNSRSGIIGNNGSYDKQACYLVFFTYYSAMPILVPLRVRAQELQLALVARTHFPSAQ